MEEYNKIMSVFNKTITKLERLAEYNESMARKNSDKIVALEAENRALTSESLQAQNTVTKLKELIS